MESRLLRCFVAVADEGTVSAAAARLHLTQPALSRQIKQLEHQLGLRLFQRTGVRLSVTSAGREFLIVAQELLRQHSQAEQIAESLAAGALPKIAIAATETTLIDVVAPFLVQFTPQDPVPDVSEIIVGPDPEDFSEDYDLVVAPQRPPRGVAYPLASLPVWAYVPSSHPWAQRDFIDLESLCAEPLIVVPTTYRSRRTFEAALTLHDVAPTSLVEVSRGRLAQALAAAGRGAAVVTDDAAFELHPLGITEPNGAALQVHLYATWREDHHAQETLRALSARLRRFCTERYGRTLPSGP